MKKDQTFWDNIAEKYARSPIKDMATYEHTMDRTRSYLKEDDQVLEIGCGTGTTALLLAPEVKHITATDLSSGMLKVGERRQAKQNVSNVDFVRTSVTGDALVGKSFDTVLAFNLIHLMSDPEEALKEVHELLKPGGFFISKTPCLGDMTRLLRPVIYIMQKIGKAPYVSYLTREQLEALFSGAGFEIVEAEDHPVGKASRFIVARKN